MLVFGGSLGARRLNDAALEAFGARPRCAVLHASGRRDYDDLRRRLDELGSPPHYRLYPYIEPFADALAAADLVVARAGGSVLELAAAGLPADARALPARHRRPPDRQRPLHGGRPGRPWWCRTPSSTGRGWRARSGALLGGAPAAGGDGQGRARGRPGPDAADRIAEGVLGMIRS